MALKPKTPEANAEPPSLPADGQTAGKSCSICQTTIIAGEQAVRCPHCELPFHQECWKENKGCSAYGCKGAPPTVKTAVDSTPFSNAWGAEKLCPSCKKTIKSEALKCRFCGANFDSRDVISSEQYASREYEGNDYAAARNKLVGLFLLSAAGCLAPLGLILCGLLAYNKEFMGLDYRRLPSTLKALLWSSIGVATLLMFILALLVVFDS